MEFCQIWSHWSSSAKMYKKSGHTVQLPHPPHLPLSFSKNPSNLFNLISLFFLPSKRPNESSRSRRRRLWRIVAAKTFEIQLDHKNNYSKFILTKPLLLKMGKSRPLFVYFSYFLITISIIQIEKREDGVLGILICGRRMVGADKTTELWRPPFSFVWNIQKATFALLPVNGLLYNIHWRTRSHHK